MTCKQDTSIDHAPPKPKQVALLCVNCGWVKPENVVDVPRCPRCKHQHELIVAEITR